MSAYVEVRALGAMQLVGFAGDFVGLMGAKPNGNEVIPQIWDEFFDRVEKADEFEFGWAVGVMVPSTKPDAVEGQMEYFAAFVTEEPPVHRPGLEIRQLEASNYVICEHLGSTDDLGETTAWFYGEYLKTSGHDWKNAPHLEVYDERFDPESDDSVVMICVPIVD